ncbi:MAG: hypothetical protein WBG11_03435 [Methylocella sp.]
MAVPSRRIERRAIDVPPARAAGIEPAGQTGRQICRVKGWRRPKMKRKRRAPQEETVDLTSLTAAVSPQALAGANCGHRGLQIMQRNNTAILGEEG